MDSRPRRRRESQRRQDTDGTDPYGPGPVARALLDDLLLLEREGRDLPAGQENPRLTGLAALLAAYRAEKDRWGL